MGTVYTSTPNELKNHLDFIRSPFTTVLLITQYGFDFDDAIRYRDLAPSKELFSKAQELKDSSEGSHWFSEYKKLFQEELDNKQHILLEIKSYLEMDSRHNMVLVCYCSDYDTCHRSIVSENLNKLGVETKELCDK